MEFIKFVTVNVAEKWLPLSISYKIKKPRQIIKSLIIFWCKRKKNNNITVYRKLMTLIYYCHLQKFHFHLNSSHGLDLDICKSIISKNFFLLFIFYSIWRRFFCLKIFIWLKHTAQLYYVPFVIFKLFVLLLAFFFVWFVRATKEYSKFYENSILDELLDLKYTLKPHIPQHVYYQSKPCQQNGPDHFILHFFNHFKFAAIYSYRNKDKKHTYTHIENFSRAHVCIKIHITVANFDKWIMRF